MRLTRTIHRRMRDELPVRPNQQDEQSAKRYYSQRMSDILSELFADELRARGIKPGHTERRLSGGLGAKRVDVSWTTAESGLLLAASVKTINFRDGRSGTYQKNLTNRRSDLLMEATTLHRRFPYAVVAGFLVFDYGACLDATDRRQSTFRNAHDRLQMNTGRVHSTGYAEQFERLYICGIDTDAEWFGVTEAGKPDTWFTVDEAFDGLIDRVATRNPDLYARNHEGGLVAA